MTELKEIPLDEIRRPANSEMLHPPNEEDEWEEFKQSVNTDLRKPLEVMETEDGYQLIDGDRRLRALREGESETAECLIKEEEHDTERWKNMVLANEFRKASNKDKRAELLAKLCQPWLLPPAERESYTQTYQQQELAEEIGVSAGTVSIWLEPIKDNNKLRDTLAATVPTTNGKMDKGDVETIDRVYDLLLGNGPDKTPIISDDGDQKGFVAEKISNIPSLSLSELESTAVKASSERWTTNKFLEYLKEHFEQDELEDQADTGMMGDSDFEDDLSGENVVQGEKADEGEEMVTAGFSEGEDDLEDDVDGRSAERDLPDWFEDTPRIGDQADYEAIFGESAPEDLYGSMIVELDDESAAAIKMACEKYGLQNHDVINGFVNQLVGTAIVAAEENPQGFAQAMEQLQGAMFSE